MPRVDAFLRVLGRRRGTTVGERRISGDRMSMGWRLRVGLWLWVGGLGLPSQPCLGHARWSLVDLLR